MKLWIIWETSTPGRLSYVTGFESGTRIDGVGGNGRASWAFVTKKEAEAFKAQYEEEHYQEFQECKTKNYVEYLLKRFEVSEDEEIRKEVYNIPMFVLATFTYNELQGHVRYVKETVEKQRKSRGCR